MENITPILESVKDKKDKMLDQIIQWSNINTHTYNLKGLKSLSELLKAEFAFLDSPVEFKPVPPQKIINSEGEVVEVPLGDVLYLQKRPNAPIQVLMVCHMDTVYSVDHPFQKTEKKDDNTLIGPGVTDAKGGICVMLHTLFAFETSPLKDQVGWQVIINSDEEIGSPGARGFIEECAKKAQYGLVYEPALPNGHLVNERKGSGNFTLVAHGKSAHAGRDFHEGRNAISALSKCIMGFNALTGQRDELTLNMGKIEGGRGLNVVADLAILRFNIRVKEQKDQDFVIKEIEKITSKVMKEDEVKLELYGDFSAPPKPFDLQTENLFNHLKTCSTELGVDLEWSASGGVCDGNRMAAAGLPTADSLGVRGGKIHSAEEFLTVDSLTEKVKLSLSFLLKLASGDIS